MSTQNGWRWCHKCQGFFFAGNPSQGVCPAGGSHDASQSAHYAALSGEGILPISEVATSQPPGGLIPAVFSIANPFTGVAVMGEATSKGTGVWGICNNGTGVNGTGTTGVNGSGTVNGVIGESTGAGYGVSGSTNSQFQPGAGGTAGVWGNNAGSGMGVKGTSNGGDGVLGYCSADGHAGVSAVNDGKGMNSYGIWAAGTPAGHFQGDVKVTGNVIVNGDVQLLLQNQDCAEDFEVLSTEGIGPGSVVVIDSVGALKQSDKAYDKRVAGVISGAGDCRPGIILGRQQVRDNRMPVALLGKVYCKVDASHEPIEVGDLLTTSPIPGHAMRAADPLRAFGAVIGKALSALKSGQGLIPVLVALQ
jgi:hypothetical protein